MACRKAKTYTIQELKDLVYAAQQDNPQGDQIMMMIADLTWCRLVTRKRLAPKSPQEKVSECEEAEKLLDRILHGERIFVLEDIPQRNADGVVLGLYGDSVPAAGLIEAGCLVPPCASPPQLYGCKQDNCGLNGYGRDNTGGNCCD